MNPCSYDDLSDADLFALCVWREARGEGDLGRRGVANVIWNRKNQPSWWGRDLRGVILAPWQFSSFNAKDPNSQMFPQDLARSWVEIQAIVKGILNGSEPDNTNGANFYHDTSIPFPPKWGLREDYKLTLQVGRLLFYRFEPQLSNHDAVSDAALGAN